ncbi:MAG TPA: hypothetical protein PLS92_00645 [Flavobacteriales bacterium]|nr:hypothetical protein [Flavobacteriales bacterium]HQV37765.1 hypothetical protein [Flavobacteriales bacterium]HQW30901.1 hypothetical protein [Flavobacteriales bacterium]HQY01426.1 hypothetical protein [Flavobacteriales bacterium]HQY79218.1 hypothetical protein [Flavobacteriales bacterium]
MNTQKALLRTSYAAFNARDIAVALRVLAPDVEWPDQLAGSDPPRSGCRG